VGILSGPDALLKLSLKLSLAACEYLLQRLPMVCVGDKMDPQICVPSLQIINGKYGQELFTEDFRFSERVRKETTTSKKRRDTLVALAPTANVVPEGLWIFFLHGLGQHTIDILPAGPFQSFLCALLEGCKFLPANLLFSKLGIGLESSMFTSDFRDQGI
jgi:hypothetical protein